VLVSVAVALLKSAGSLLIFGTIGAIGSLFTLSAYRLLRDDDLADDREIEQSKT
jgi:hypothetical protein